MENTNKINRRINVNYKKYSFTVCDSSVDVFNRRNRAYVNIKVSILYKTQRR